MTGPIDWRRQLNRADEKREEEKQIGSAPLPLFCLLLSPNSDWKVVCVRVRVLHVCVAPRSLLLLLLLCALIYSQTALVF